VPGTPPERLAAGDWAEHHSPLFRIAPEPSIKAGVEAMTLAALDLLAPADATAGAGLNRAGTTP
jgi:hippurate hydrolase